MNIDTKTVLMVLIALLILICIVLARTVYRLSCSLDEDSEWQQALDAEIERAGWAEQYRYARTAAHLAVWDRRNAARIKAEAEAEAKIEAEVRAARIRAYAAEAKATPEAQAKRDSRAAKASGQRGK